MFYFVSDTHTVNLSSFTSLHIMTQFVSCELLWLFDRHIQSKSFIAKFIMTKKCDYIIKFLSVQCCFKLN